jgi:hypothetical protein
MSTLSYLRTMDDATARRARTVAAATAVSAGFALIHYTPLALVTVSGAAAVVLLVTAALAAAAAQLRRPALLLVSGGVLLLVGLFRLVTYGHGTALIGGAASTAALLAGLGLAHLGLLAARTPPMTASPGIG